jgi:hypothetical protein
MSFQKITSIGKRPDSSILTFLSPLNYTVNPQTKQFSTIFHLPVTGGAYGR